jgi:hypothetical protein
MERDLSKERRQAHASLDQLAPAARAIADAPNEDEEISEEEKQAVERSKEWFRHNDGIPFEQVAAELGLTMEQIRTDRP